MTAKPFDDLLVLDLSRYLLGGFMSEYFADFGARVIKVEDTKVGDYCRNEEPLKNGESHYHYALDRNKESLSINLKDEEALNFFYELVKRADIIIENYRPGVSKRLKIDYKTLYDINQGIIYCSFSAYGQNDPRSLKPLHDINIVAETGYYDLNGGNVPVIPPCDLAASMVGLQAVLTALYQRTNTNKGAHIDASMVNSFMWWNSIVDCRWDFFGSKLDTNSIEYPSVGYNIYRTKDDRMLAFGFYEHKFWNEFCDDINHPELRDTLKDTKDQNPEAYNAITRIVKSKTYEEWSEWLSTRDHCITPILTKTEALESYMTTSPSNMKRVTYPRLGQVLQTNLPHVLNTYSPSLDDAKEPPMLGQDSKEIMKELGASDQIVEEMLERGAIKD